MAMKYRWKYKTPEDLDDILLFSDGKYLTGLLFENGKTAAEYEESYREELLPVFKETAKWLDIYFTGKDPGFTPPYRLGDLSPFRKRVLDILAGIPYGETLSYGKIASTIAEERGIGKMSSRAVGQAVARNPISLIIPCHRVIGSDGSLTGYGGGIRNKIALLKHEGIKTAINDKLVKEKEESI